MQQAASPLPAQDTKADYHSSTHANMAELNQGGVLYASEGGAITGEGDKLEEKKEDCSTVAQKRKSVDEEACDAPSKKLATGEVNMFLVFSPYELF